MAKQTELDGVDALWIGADYLLEYTVKNAAETAIVDITSWTLSWLVKRFATDTSAQITKTTGAGSIVISGTYDADPDTNTQIATVTIDDTDTDDLVPGRYVWELKRTDAGSETVLAYGIVRFLRAVHLS